MYSAFNEYNTDMSPMYKLDDFYPNIASDGEVEYKTDFRKLFYGGDASIFGYNRYGEILDFNYFNAHPNNFPAEDFESSEEGQNDMEDIDPALFCPDIIMELGDTPIIIDTDEETIDGSTCKDPNLPGITVSNYQTADGHFDLTSEEDELRKQKYGVHNPVQFSRIHCTSCNGHMGSALSERSNMLMHPLLKVLICKECYNFYISGEFEKDCDGSETYCRWCGQGGLVICCSTCEFVFCAKCIRNNLGRKILTKIRASDEWTCFKCDTSQLIHLRVQCAELLEYVRSETARATIRENINTDYSKCCLTTNNQTGETKKAKRKYSDDDQDYDPSTEQLSRQSSSSSIKSIYSIYDDANTDAEKTFVPKLVNLPKSTGMVTQVCPNTTTVTVNSTNSTKVTFVSHPKPALQKVKPPFTLSNVRSLSVDSSKVRVLPNGQKVTIITPRHFISSSTSARQSSTQNFLLQSDRNSEHQRKKMCYETAVRAAGHINSNLSCNLIKLREEKLRARKLDDLVGVHNKLQEVLNASINSLTQLKKTLLVADMKNSIIAPPALKQIFVNPDPVPNYFKVTPSATLRNVNVGFSGNCEEAKFTKEQKHLKENVNNSVKVNAAKAAGNAGLALPPLIILSDSTSSINLE